jgi:phenylacetate-CoA ligase
MLQLFQTVAFNWKNSFFRKNAVRQYRESLSNCSLTQDEIIELNFLKRKKLISYAYENIKFYMEYYDIMNFHPKMLKSEEDWKLVPVLEKDIVRLNIVQMKNPFVEDKYFSIATTGGSTGIPLKIYTDKRFHFETLGWRAFKWWGISPAANVGIIHRRTPTTNWGIFKNRLLWFPTKRIYLNASSINNKDLEVFVNQIIRKKIVWLQGYVGGLEKVADYIIQNSIKITTIKLIWSTSAPLTKNVRLKLEKAFGCKIMNQYGSCEVPNIAIQCPDNNDLHINYDYVHLEIIDNQGNLIYDNEGDILVTDLENYVFPLIKYRLGDRGTLVNQLCDCKNPLPMIQEIKGRISDAIHTPNGLFIDGSYLTTIFDEYTDYISQFQVYQKSDYSITIYVTLFEHSLLVQDILFKIKHMIDKKVEYQVPVNVEIVDNINDDKGKIRYIISEINQKISF